MKQTTKEKNFYGMGLSDLRPIDPNITKAVKVLHAINHKLRMRMIDILLTNGETCVTDLYIRLRLEQSVCSNHLAILRRIGVVKTKRYGKQVMYAIDDERLDQIMRICKQLASS